MLLEATIATVITGLVLPVVIVVSLMFLPSIIELRKRRDAGPRFIPDCFTKKEFGRLVYSLVDAETGLISNQFTVNGSFFPSFLSNIEA